MEKRNAKAPQREGRGAEQGTGNPQRRTEETLPRAFVFYHREGLRQ
jgi:hypothetical protein